MTNASKLILPATMIGLPTFVVAAAILFNDATFTVVIAVMTVLAVRVVIAGLTIARRVKLSPELQLELDNTMASIGYRKEDQSARVKSAWFGLYALIGLVAWVAGWAFLR